MPIFLWRGLFLAIFGDHFWQKIEKCQSTDVLIYCNTKGLRTATFSENLKLNRLKTKILQPVLCPNFSSK
jgi:hypothetical protein